MGIDPQRIYVVFFSLMNVGGHAQYSGNVAHVVEIHGGKQVYGWSFYVGKHAIEARYHTVWQPDAEAFFINIAYQPSSNELPWGLFVPDKLCTRRVLGCENAIWWK